MILTRVGFVQNMEQKAFRAHFSTDLHYLFVCMVIVIGAAAVVRLPNHHFIHSTNNLQTVDCHCFLAIVEWSSFHFSIKHTDRLLASFPNICYQKYRQNLHTTIIYNTNE